MPLAACSAWRRRPRRRSSRRRGRDQPAVGPDGPLRLLRRGRAVRRTGDAHPARPRPPSISPLARINRQQRGRRRRRRASSCARCSITPRWARAPATRSVCCCLYQGRDAEALPLSTAAAATAPATPSPPTSPGRRGWPRTQPRRSRGSQRASAIDPRLRSAHYGAFQALQRLAAAARPRRHAAPRRVPGARARSARAARRVQVPRGWGPLAEAVTVDAPFRRRAARRAAVPRRRLLRSRALPQCRAPPARRARCTAADIDGDGAPRPLRRRQSASPTTRPNAVLFGRATPGTASPGHPLAGVPGVRAALWGDIDNDGRHRRRARARRRPYGTVAPVGAERVARRHGRTSGRPRRPSMPSTARSSMPTTTAISTCWLANARGPNGLLNNNGDGTFRPIARAGRAGRGRTARRPASRSPTSMATAITTSWC